MKYLLAFGLAMGVTAALTPVVRAWALRHGVVDRPDGGRKRHGRPVAYLGGVAIFTGFVVAVASFLPLNRQLVALLAGCAVLVVVGVVDDMRGLSPWVKLGWQFVAAGVALAGGIGITSVTNPLGGIIDLSWGRTDFEVLGFGFHIMPLANSLSLLWMVGLANTVNFLDGLDGLACGVSAIGALVLFLLAVGPEVHQPTVAVLAVVVAGAALGFLPFNFYPARIFMGDSGAYFLGLVLAMLAVYSGAKLATAALVLGFPIVDAVWAAVRRVARGQSPFKADRGHFHHLLVDTGLRQREAVLVLYAAAAGLGAVALVTGSLAKLVALAVMVAAVLVVTMLLGWRLRKNNRVSL